MNNDEPIAYFITWTVYGTFLQGDIRGWRKRLRGEQPAQPLLAQWHRDRLSHSIELLSRAHRTTVETEIARLSEFRSWHLWSANARSNHVHVVITAKKHMGNVVRDQLKANCTRTLRQNWTQFSNRPVWTKGGDWQCVFCDDELEDVIQYVRVAQDRMHLDERKRAH